MKDLSIYIHIPFCRSKCSYCDFNSSTGSQKEISDYLVSLEKELSHMSNLIKTYRVKSIFVGGGTPSILNLTQLKTLLEFIKRYIPLEDLEFTIECNPDSLTEEKLTLMKIYKVNRLSIGLQSTVDSELTLLGRVHSYDKFLSAYKLAREVGFDNISVDLMFAFPNQEIESLELSLSRVIAIEPQHISCYSLIIEENTPLENEISSGNLTDISDDNYVAMYELMVGMLTKAGYKQYEISNFAKEGKESFHNIGYWTHREYLGFGLGAHSYFRNFRFENSPIISTYQSTLANNKLPRENITFINKVDFLEEEVMLRLRMNEGINLNYYWDIVKEAYPNISLAETQKIVDKISQLKDSNLLVAVDDKLKLTDKGREISNSIILDLIP